MLLDPEPYGIKEYTTLSNCVDVLPSNNGWSISAPSDVEDPYYYFLYIKASAPLPFVVVVEVNELLMN